MSRDITSGMLVQVTGDTIAPVFFLRLAFDSGTVRFWTGVGQIVWNSQTWTGTGHLLNISAVEETAEMKATGLQITLTGVTADVISLALNEDIYGREAILYIGAINSSGEIVSTPYALFKGFMDTMDMVEDGDTAEFQLNLENQLISLERPNKQLYTTERQHLDYPDDEGFSMVPDLQDREVRWGRR